MHAFFKVASAFALLAYSSATPVVQRSSHHQAHFELPKTFAALGDSYAAGLGSGFFTNNSRDGLDSKLIDPTSQYLLTRIQSSVYDRMAVTQHNFSRF